MPLYTMQVTLKVWGRNQRQAYDFVKHGLSCARKQEIEYVDAEVTETEPDESAEDDEAWSGGFAENH